MIVNLFHCCLIKNLKTTKMIVRVPYLSACLNDNLFDCCLIGEKYE
jgi:hypothetical protein